MYTKLNIGREQCTAETYCALNVLFIIVAISIRAAMVTWMVVRQTFLRLAYCVVIRTTCPTDLSESDPQNDG
jgi:uncharacterized membrane protein